MQYHNLGIYSQLVEVARKDRPLFNVTRPGPEVRKQVIETLGFGNLDPTPQDVKVERKWTLDGVDGEEISWFVGYGPRTRAWYLRPAGVTKPLPGVLALHDHGGFKYFGKEKIAQGPDPVVEVLTNWRRDCYGSRAYPNELAKHGYAVLVPDTFCWGSRRFPLSVMSATTFMKYTPFDETTPTPTPEQQQQFEAVARDHENVVEKYCTVLGASMAGVIAYEDRVATTYLASRADVLKQPVGSLGLSGGGLRTTLLNATDDRIGAAVVVGLMATYPSMLDRSIRTHTWMFFPGQLSRWGDWTDLAACRAPSPLMCQYDEEDPLFTLAGQHEADERLSKLYASVGAEKNYEGRFYPGGHKFDQPMQHDAFAFLDKHLKR